MNIVISLVVFIGVICVSKAQLSIGDWCSVDKTKLQGKCSLLVMCPKAIENIKNGILPQTCGFQGVDPIVCCTEPTASVTETRFDSNRPNPIKSTTPTTLKRRKPGEISLQKCKEYDRYSVTKPPSIIPEYDDIEYVDCTYKSTGLIIGGNVAQRSEFPHMAIIGFEAPTKNIEWLCGGSLISEQYVVTSAHCLRHFQYGTAAYVKLGVTYLDDTEDQRFVQQLRIIAHIENPQYKYPERYHDIGLLEMERPATMNPKVRPACLYNKNNINVKNAIDTEWNLVENSLYSSSSYKKLTKLILDYASTESCNKSYSPVIGKTLRRGIDGDTQICAGSNPSEKDLCRLTTGGPLQIYHTDDGLQCMYDIVGISSFGMGCTKNVPNVYTKVSNYIQWIEDIVWPQ